MADLDAQTRDRIEDLAGDMIADEVKNWDAVKLADALRAVLDVLNGYALSPAHSGIVAELRSEIAQELGVKP